MTVKALPARRGAVWIAVAGSVAIIAGVAGSAGSVMSQPTGAMTLADISTASLTLAYSCRFPAGTYQVGAHVTASYPATTQTGRAVRPAALTLAVTVPAAALSGLRPRGAPVALSARLATSDVVRATGGAAPASASIAPEAWASLAASPRPLSAPGADLASGPLRPSAPPPALTATRSGTMTVTAGSLSLRYAQGRTPAQTVTAACTLEPGQDAALATIAVRAAAANSPAKTPVFCPPLPRGGLKLNRSKRMPQPPKPPRGSTVSFPPSTPGCAYIKGYADARKLNGAALIGPGLLDLSIGVRVVVNFAANYFEEDSVGEFDYRPCPTCAIVHALPPARATFLAFGVEPVSATLQLFEVGTINIYGVGTLSGVLTSNTAWSLMTLRISDVTVNGNKNTLNVGNDCETVKPLQIGLTGIGTGPQPYSLQSGGPLTGEVTILPFTHCGVTENLDYLFTGTVSGKGNYSVFTQGSLCAPVGDQGCPPPIPNPVR
jgi:hypothetical protein